MDSKRFKYLLIVLIILVTTPSVTNLVNWTNCQSSDSWSNCTCSNITINVVAKCDLNHVTDLIDVIKAPQNVVRLDLSANRIRDISTHSFQNYSHLIYLSLSSNKIHTITREAFRGLTRLRELNLQDNMIKQWDTTLIEQDLPNLIMLNIVQNVHWKPDQQILSLPKLKILYLLLEINSPNKRKSSFGCHLLHNNQTTRSVNYTFIQKFPDNFQEKVDADSLLIKRPSCWYQKMIFRNASYLDVIKKKGFYFHCGLVQLDDDLVRQQSQLYYLKTMIRPYCYSVIQKISILTLVIVILSMVFNLVVISTTLRSRVLRESVAHVLVGNIAVGDLLISFYMIIITSTRQIMDAIEYNDFYLPYYCRIVGIFFLIGQFSSPLMSFIMTLERYLAVVYCMRPHIRITSRTAYVAIIIIWSLSLSLAVSFMTSSQFSIKTDTICVPYININNQQVLTYVGGIGIAVYIFAIALYVHMYLDFQKTNSKTVQLQRENRLACRIALIMFTNLFFFILPMVLILILYSFQSFRFTMDGNILLKTFGIICLGINSCCNPILFSFRNETFRGELRKLNNICKNRIRNQAN